MIKTLDRRNMCSGSAEALNWELAAFVRSPTLSNTPDADVSYRTVWRISNTHMHRRERGKQAHAAVGASGRLLLAPLSPLSGKKCGHQKRVSPAVSIIQQRRPVVSSPVPKLARSLRPIAWVVLLFWLAQQPNAELPGYCVWLERGKKSGRQHVISNCAGPVIN